MLAFDMEELYDHEKRFTQLVGRYDCPFGSIMHKQDTQN